MTTTDGKRTPCPARGALARRALGGLVLLVVLALTGTAAAAAAAAAATGGGTVGPAQKVGHNQWFFGTVNGSSGSPTPVTIKMACAGPVKPGEEGHPVAGQTVAVVTPVAILSTDGFTGPRGTEIGAFFGAPPPAGAVGTSGPVYFRRYRTAKIPRSELLPCGGSGHVILVPLPLAQPSKHQGPRDVVVPVTYSGQP